MAVPCCDGAGPGCIGLGEAGAFDSLAEVFSLHFYDDTHLLQAGAHAFSDAVAEGFASDGAAGFGEAVVGIAAGGGGARFVGEIGGNDGGTILVVAAVEDVGGGVPGPVAGGDVAEVVEDEEVAGDDGLEEFVFGAGGAEAVDGAEVVEEFLVLPEDAGGAAVGDEGFEDADGEVGFAEAAGAGEEEAFAFGLDGEALGELAGGAEGGFDAVVGGFVYGLVAIEGAEFVAAGDAGLLEIAGGAALEAAVAGLGEAMPVGLLDDTEA